jgi:hypothetical protein
MHLKILVPSLFGLAAIPLIAMAQPVPLTCFLQFENGREAYRIFEVNIDSGISDIGNNVSIQTQDSHVTLFWESIACSAQRIGAASTLICLNNLMHIDRRTLRSNGVIEGIHYSGMCQIGHADRQF